MKRPVEEDAKWGELEGYTAPRRYRGGGWETPDDHVGSYSGLPSERYLVKPTSGFIDWMNVNTRGMAMWVYHSDEPQAWLEVNVKAPGRQWNFYDLENAGQFGFRIARTRK